MKKLGLLIIGLLLLAGVSEAAKLAIPVGTPTQMIITCTGTPAIQSVLITGDAQCISVRSRDRVLRFSFKAPTYTTADGYTTINTGETMFISERAYVPNGNRLYFMNAGTVTGYAELTYWKE